MVGLMLFNSQGFQVGIILALFLVWFGFAEFLQIYMHMNSLRAEEFTKFCLTVKCYAGVMFPGFVFENFLICES